MKPFTVDELLAAKPFKIAHRGSGDNWTEHTLSAYASAIAAGARAIEVSVHRSVDGVFVCHHDTNLKRLTGVDQEIATMAYRDLSTINNDHRAWLGPAAAPQAIPALRHVLDEFAAKYVIFIEDKTGSYARELLDIMDSYPNATNHFVWKQTAAAEQYKLARARGYRVWGYFVDSKDDKFAQYARSFDLVGIYHGATDEEIVQLVDYGLPVICWEIHSRWMRDRVLKLGVTGLMCSNYPYVAVDTPQATADAFVTGLRSPGDLPWILSTKYQPKIVAQTATLRLDFDSGAAYQMGSLGPIEAANYSLSFDMRWPDALPGGDAHAGVSFGIEDDQPYRPTVPGTVGGYHLVFRAGGQVQLFRRDPGPDPGDPLDAFTSAPAVLGEWASFKIDVSPTGITYSRGGDPAWSSKILDDSYRGGYVGLNKNYASTEAVEFRAIKVS